MRVFVTGASGFVGSAVVRELIAHGHQVLGLARSDEGAAAVAAAGAQVHRGSLEDLDSLRAGAAQADGVIHTAFNHDFSKFAQNSEDDRRAIETLGAALEGSDRPLLVTSGVVRLAQGRAATEDDTPAPIEGYPRVSEATAQGLAARGVRAAVMRLPPTVHGAGDKGFVARLVALAREAGVSAYPGEGANRWPAVHRLDAARAYRLALEHATPGARYHAVAEDGLPMRRIAEAIGQGLSLPVVSKTGDDAARYYGWFAMFAAADAPTSSARTRRDLGWTPEQPDLLADMGPAGYFEG